MYQTFSHSGFESRVWSCGGARLAGEPPELYVKAHGRVTCNGRFRLEQIHGTLAVHIFDAGAGVFEVDGIPHAIEAGDMVAVHPGVHVRYYDRPESPWRYSWFTLAGIRAVPLAEASGLKRSDPVIKTGWAEAFSELFSRIESAYIQDHVSPFLTASLGWDALGVVASRNRLEAGSTQETLVDHAALIMQQNYHRGLQVEDVARGLGVSRATLFRRFRDKLDQSPKAYLDELRLTQAHQLLRRGHSTVKEVAYACGFNCPHYFSRAYAKRYGTPPSKTRVK